MYEWVWLIIAVLAVPMVALMIWDSQPTMSSVEHAAARLWRDLGPLGGLALVGFGALVLFTPSIVAYHRGHHNAMAIFAFNLLLGLTGVGWAIALVWALTAVRGNES
jgi:hypothetical protein